MGERLRVDMSVDRLIADGPVAVVVELVNGWMEGGASVPGVARVLQRIEARQDAMLALLMEAADTEAHMSQEVDDLVAQVANTNGTMESAVVAFNGFDARLADLQTKLDALGVDTSLVVGMRTDLQTHTQALAEAIAAIPPVVPAGQGAPSA